MARPRSSKLEALRAKGALHPRPEAVRDPLFDTRLFFDRHDLVQVKYEMLRRVDVDGHPAGVSAKVFGFSRPTFYQAQAAFKRDGLPGLLPRKRGPRAAYKLGNEVVAFLLAVRSEEGLGARALAKRVQERFDLHVHARSIERALRRAEKKRW